ncbi:zinc ribbon domain-containing protein [Paenibacillus rubinfantis]|jgi:hypothetical protein|uniref:zinc ribbon domain-containing protein n=1 Tax=Paenibacillus rubinfantis TaxID=1720296 RepID=UPI00073F4E73|nr:zinc ribbon domain-containing protein [Paenibacillus rubinfantis]
MNCTHCGYPQEKGRFCVKCGSPLLAGNEPSGAAEAAPAASDPGQGVPAITSLADGWNKVKQSETTKQGLMISKQYWTYFLKALLHPFQTTQNVTANHFTNGMITIVLTALFFPLVFIIGESKYGGHVSFGSGFLKPFLLIWIALLLASAISFAVIRLARVSTNYVSVTAKFGTMLVPAVAALVLAILTIVLDIKETIPVLFLIISILIVFSSITAVVLSTRKESITGLDPLYGAMIANLVFGYIFFKFIEYSVSSILSDIFGGYGMYGGFL